MRIVAKLMILTAVVITVCLTGTNTGHAGLAAGDAAPGFKLNDIKGRSYDLAVIKDQPMVILYFFDVESRSSQEGLLHLDSLAKKYEDADLMVWAIAVSSREKVARFVSRTRPVFPVLLDTGTVSDLYHARQVLPTVCILGPGQKMMDYFQGGGKTTEIMLVRLAQRKLQHKQPQMAKVISEQVVKKNPGNIKAKSVKGYAELKQGDLDAAEKTFSGLAKAKGKGEVLGKEGLISVYAQKGETEKALKTAKEVEKKGGNRAYVHVVKGDLLYSQNRKKEAETEYKKAIGKKIAEPFQQAVAYNQLGRIHAARGEYEKSRELYDQAVEIDPYYIEATSNKGVTYEKEGRWDKALELYQQVQTINKNDIFAAILAKKAQEMLLLQKDNARKERIDKFVKELAQRYREKRFEADDNEDTWTSRPMVLSFVDFQEKGGLAARDGFSTVLTTQLAEQLNASGRVQVVERVLIERLLEELNLGTSALADPATTLRLGKVLAAKIMGTGSLYYLPGGPLLSLRLIDTETSAIPKVINRKFNPGVSLEKELHRLNREILMTIMLHYPLQGYVVQVNGAHVLINLGSNQGVVQGTGFDIIEEQAPIEFKGKILKAASKPIARLEVYKVDDDFSYAMLSNQRRPIKSEDKIIEKIDDMMSMGAGNAVQ